MARRTKPEKRPIPPDPRYGNVHLQIFINKLMRRGKKSVAEKVVYGALERIQNQTGRDPLDVFQQAIRQATPVLEVKPRRVGGATYQVPVEVRPDRRQSLAIRWLVEYARRRSGRTMVERLAAELLDAANGQGASVKRREDTHRMAEANKAFGHYRW